MTDKTATDVRTMYIGDRIRYHGEHMGGLTGELFAKAADEIERLRTALRIIAGEEQRIDNLISNSDVARIALHGR